MGILCLQTFALRQFLFLFFKAAVFKLKLENIYPQMAVVLILSSQNGLLY